MSLKRRFGRFGWRLVELAVGVAVGKVVNRRVVSGLAEWLGWFGRWLIGKRLAVLLSGSAVSWIGSRGSSRKGG